MPGALEATEGVASELVTHDAKSFASEDELSPEERAMNGIEIAPAMTRQPVTKTNPPPKPHWPRAEASPPRRESIYV